MELKWWFSFSCSAMCSKTMAKGELLLLREAFSGDSPKSLAWTLTAKFSHQIRNNFVFFWKRADWAATLWTMHGNTSKDRSCIMSQMNSLFVKKLRFNNKPWGCGWRQWAGVRRSGVISALPVLVPWLARALKAPRANWLPRVRENLPPNIIGTFSVIYNIALLCKRGGTTDAPWYEPVGVGPDEG